MPTNTHRFARILPVVVTLVSPLLGCGASATPGDAAQAHRAGSAGISSLHPRAPQQSAAGQPSLRVLSFNINFGVGHDPKNIRAVAEADADLVFLQETTEQAEAAFREAMGSTYPYMLFRACCRAGGLGILSKYPIREQTYLQSEIGWFPAWRVVVQTPLGLVQALNVHLRPPISDGGSWVAGYFSTRTVRQQEIKGFWPAIDHELPTLVVGDFNENADGKAIAWLSDKGLTSALPQFSPRAKTWRWHTTVGKLKAQLDHIVYSPALLPLSAQVLDRGNSDHMPVLAVFAAAP